MCEALGILNKTNKVPNPQEADILMREINILNKHTSVFQVVTNILKK